jgi:sirohydrochlorin cobaltochelatase
MANDPVTEAIVLFAHGARDPSWAGPVLQLKALVAAQRPDAYVEAAFLERLEPTLGDAVGRLVAQGADRITVFPLFMAPSGHLRRDVPLLLEEIRAAHPTLDIQLAPPIGAVAELLAAIAGWVARFDRDQ